MTKANVTKLFMGSLIAIVAGVFLVAVGFMIALATGTFVMEGPDVTGFQLSSSAPAAFGLAFYRDAGDHRRRDRPVRGLDRGRRQYVTP